MCSNLPLSQSNSKNSILFPGALVNILICFKKNTPHSCLPQWSKSWSNNRAPYSSIWGMSLILFWVSEIEKNHLCVFLNPPFLCTWKKGFILVKQNSNKNKKTAYVPIPWPLEFSNKMINSYIIYRYVSKQSDSFRVFGQNSLYFDCFRYSHIWICVSGFPRPLCASKKRSRRFSIPGLIYFSYPKKII